MSQSAVEANFLKKKKLKLNKDGAMKEKILSVDIGLRYLEAGMKVNVGRQELFLEVSSFSVKYCEDSNYKW
jgi:hypothetical protein